jgi:hypothetical protein
MSVFEPMRITGLLFFRLAPPLLSVRSSSRPFASFVLVPFLSQRCFLALGFEALFFLTVESSFIKFSEAFCERFLRSEAPADFRTIRGQKRKF